MRKIAFIFLIPVITFFMFCRKDDHTGGNDKATRCIPSSLKPGLLAFYSFSGGSINDFSGNNNNLNNINNAIPTTDRNGNNNCAFEFNTTAINQFLTTTKISFLNNLNQFSISLWYEPLDTARDLGSLETLVCRDTGLSCPDRRGQWSISLYDCRKAVFGRQNSVWDTNITNPSCSKELIARTGSWHHLVATYNKQSEEMKIYRDGVLQNTANGPAICSSEPTPVPKDKGDLFIGINYIGKTDDILIYNKTLSQAEIELLSKMSQCCSN